MWISLSKEEIFLLVRALDTQSNRNSSDTKMCDELGFRLIDDMEARFDPNNQRWVDLAFEQFHEDGEIEIDRQADGSSFVSESEDGGAYVLAWVYADPKNES